MLFSSVSLPLRHGVVCAALCLLGTSAVRAADMPTLAPAPAAAPAKADRMAAGREAIRASDWKKSISELSAAVREQPNNADAHNLLAYAYRKQATPDLAKAFEHYNTALRLDPNHKGAHEYIGEAYLMDKNPAKAELHLAQLRTICGGTGCEEYQDLAQAIGRYKVANK